MQTYQPTVIQSAPSGKQGGVLGALGTIASAFIPGAAPFVAGANAIQGLVTGNPQQAASGIVGATQGSQQQQQQTNPVSTPQPTQVNSQQGPMGSPMGVQQNPPTGTNLTDIQNIIKPQNDMKGRESFSDYSVHEMIPILEKYPPAMRDKLMAEINNEYSRSFAMETQARPDGIAPATYQSMS